MKLWCLLLTLAFGACGSDEPPPTCHDDGTCATGEACTANTGCASGICDETCLDPCTDEDQCGVAQSCRVLDLDGTPVSACVARGDALGDLGDTCGGDDECRGGVCRDGRCTELCSSCTAGAICVPDTRGGLSVGVCEWAPAAPVVSLGPIPAGLEGSEEVMFTIPAGLESFTVVVRDATPGGTRRVGIGALRAPDGEVLDNGDLDHSDPNPASIRYPDAATVMVPIRDTASTVEPGVYTVVGRIWDIDFDAPDPFVPTSGELYFDLVYEWAGERGGLLDLNVFVTSIDDAFLSTALDVVETQFAAAGVALGNVVGATLPAPYDVIADSETVRALCRDHSAPGQWRTAVNVFLVDELDFALGFTGGTPSPPGMVGLAPSGTVVEVGTDATQTGIVLAHELGHFLGLDHTTAFNADGSVFSTDPISDTPECASSGSNCPDRANLMFPIIDFAQAHSLSPGQLDVLARNPALYELVYRDLCPGAAVRDVTTPRRAAGFLDAGSADSGSCADGAAAGAAHVLRVSEPTTVTFVTTGSATAVHVREGACDGPEVVCGAAGELSAELDRGEYFVFVDGTAGPYTLEIR